MTREELRRLERHSRLTPMHPLMKTAFLAAIGVIVAAFCFGCVVEGHRRFTVEALGQTVVIEDEVSPNDEGKQEYLLSFDEAGLNVIGWVIELFKPADEPAESPAGAGTQGEDDG